MKMSILGVQILSANFDPSTALLGPGPLLTGMFALVVGLYSSAVRKNYNAIHTGHFKSLAVTFQKAKRNR